jgi:hypothetical protein
MKNWSSVFLGLCVLGAAVIFSFKSPEPAFSQVTPPPPLPVGMSTKPARHTAMNRPRAAFANFKEDP